MIQAISSQEMIYATSFYVAICMLYSLDLLGLSKNVELIVRNAFTVLLITTETDTNYNNIEY